MRQNLYKYLSKTKNTESNAFNLTFMYIDDVLSINNPNFANWIPLMYRQITLFLKKKQQKQLPLPYFQVDIKGLFSTSFIMYNVQNISFFIITLFSQLNMTFVRVGILLPDGKRSSFRH